VPRGRRLPASVRDAAIVAAAGGVVPTFALAAIDDQFVAVRVRDDSHETVVAGVHASAQDD
jgi:hypothetical protein